MSRPLLISDCDEVLLHMVSHFAEWLEQDRGYRFEMEGPSFLNAVRDASTGEPIASDQVWPLLDTFFIEETHRQNVVPGALEALAEIEKVAEVVILTNLPDEHHAIRVNQLAAFDMRYEVLCNQGGKGPPVRELVERLQPSVTVFVDDLAVHHESVAEHAPDVWRLHMIAEPKIARISPPAPHAHARIDDWDEAKGWVLERLKAGSAA